MLWREAFRSRSVPDRALPAGLEAPDGTIVILVGGVEALASLGVWVRLCEGEFDADSWRAVLVGEAAEFAEALPPSRLAACSLASAAEVPPGTTVAGVARGGRLTGAIEGAATEEAWEAIIQARAALI